VHIEIGHTYTNSLGAVMIIRSHAALNMNVIGEIYVAESPDNLFGTRTYLVTVEGLMGAGYHEVLEADK
jgi:hypothetical protein